eukprot:UN06418
MTLEYKILSWAKQIQMVNRIKKYILFLKNLDTIYGTWTFKRIGKDCRFRIIKESEHREYVYIRKLDNNKERIGDIIRNKYNHKCFVDPKIKRGDKILQNDIQLSMTFTESRPGRELKVQDPNERSRKSGVPMYTAFKKESMKEERDIKKMGGSFLKNVLFLNDEEIVSCIVYAIKFAEIETNDKYVKDPQCMKWLISVLGQGLRCNSFDDKYRNIIAPNTFIMLNDKHITYIELMAKINKIFLRWLGKLCRNECNFEHAYENIFDGEKKNVIFLKEWIILYSSPVLKRIESCLNELETRRCETNLFTKEHIKSCPECGKRKK